MGDIIVGSEYMDTGYLDNTGLTDDKIAIQRLMKVIKVITCYISGEISERKYSHKIIALAETLLKEERIPADRIKQIIENRIPSEVITFTKDPKYFSTIWVS